MIRYLITILLLFPFAANATTYYVSNAGSDANNGTSTGTSWQTISKVNGFTFSSGDSILLNKGDTWNERLIVPRTFLYFGAYGTGIKPLITGFQTQAGFTQSGNVWTATATNAADSLNCVLLNGSFAIKARTPNTGWSTFSSYSGDSIINTPETGTPSRVGKEIVVRTATWIIDVTNVLTQSTGQLKLSPKLTATPNLLGNGYFFQNDSSFVDVANEYSYSRSNKRLSVYSTSSPTVLISIFDTLVKCKKGTTFENIDFTGANRLIIKIDSSCSIKNSCRLQYAGWDAIQGDGNSNIFIDADSIMDVYNNGITDDWNNAGNNFTLTNSYIKRIGRVAGMGKSGNGTYTGFLGFPSNALFEYNRIDSIGYNGIHFASYPTIIQHNYITHCGITKADAGSIYTFAGQSGNIIRANIVGNNPGGTGGISGNDIANGIYIDDFSFGQIIDSNTVFNCKWSDCFFHDSPNAAHTLTNNLFEDSVDRPFYTNTTYNMAIKKNIFYSRNASQDILYVDNTSSATIDSNYYLRPVLLTAAVRWGGTLYDIATFTPDTHRNGMPALADATVPVGILYINPTKADSTISLPSGNSTTYVDVKGKLYTHSITLHPYQSALLFVSTLNRVDGIHINSLR